MHTASENSNFTMHFAPSPIDNASIIRNVIQDNKAKKNTSPQPSSEVERENI